MDLRAQCNAKYTEFLKQAWVDFCVLLTIPRPKDEVVPPVRRPKDDTSPIQDNQVPIDEVVMPIEAESQPLPVSPIYEDKQQEAQGFVFNYSGTV